MRVIGTAGHVDHGKSTLVKRLTGIDPDRLAEEKAREMTIDLGFAWLTLPDGETLGIVDVPGHRDFIENMLAGVGGIDAVLFVVAADEGIMPQTREHLAILDLLGIQNGLVALTKCDMVDDADWLALVEQDIHEALRGTTLAGAEIVRVSARTGQGIAALMEKLSALLNGLPRRADYGHPRLPVDRVFTIMGFGTVVTGTLLGGALRVGDEVELQPSNLHGRVRGLQSYKQSVEIAYPGSRVAVNVAGVDKTDVSRGVMLTHAGEMQSTTLVDVFFRHLPDASRPLKHDSEIKFFSGTSESHGKVRLLDAEILVPGAQGWLQIRLENPLPLAQGDRFILRYPSPGETIGGGVIVDPHPAKRWKRMSTPVILSLETRMQGSPAQRVAQAAEGSEPVKRAALQKLTGFNDIDAAIQAALDEKQLVQFPDGTLLAVTSTNAITRRIYETVSVYHTMHPLRAGIPREELRSRLGMKQAALNLFLDANMLPDIVAAGNMVRLTSFSIQFTPQQQTQIHQLEQAMVEAPYTPPSFDEAAQLVGSDVLRALIDLGHIVQVQPDVIFSRAVYDEMVQAVLMIIDRDGTVTAKALRDHFNTSRKYAIGLLEHLDALQITKRVGDDRVRGKNAKPS